MAGAGRPVARPIGDLHDEWVGAVQHVPFHAVGHPAQSGVGQRLLALEDAFSGDAQVDALSGRAPALLAFGRVLEVGGFGPDDGGAVVGGAQDAPVDLIAELLQLPDESAPGLTGSGRVRHQVLQLHRHTFAIGSDGAIELDHTPGLWAALGDQRAPLQDLLDVLQGDQPWALDPAPAAGDPGEAAQLLAAWLAAPCLAVVGAIRRQVQQAHRPPLGGLAWAHLEHVFPVVLSLWVVGRVHAAGVFVVVDGDIDVATGCLLDGFGHATAAGELIDQQLIVQAPYELRGLHQVVSFFGNSAAIRTSKPSSALRVSSVMTCSISRESASPMHRGAARWPMTITESRKARTASKIPRSTNERSTSRPASRRFSRSALS